jgi:hypothetical protein
MDFQQMMQQMMQDLQRNAIRCAGQAQVLHDNILPDLESNGYTVNYNPGSY